MQPESMSAAHDQGWVPCGKVRPFTTAEKMTAELTKLHTASSLLLPEGMAETDRPTDFSDLHHA